MNRNTGRTSYIESGKWDERTIDGVYEEQLDRIGGILDRLQTSGLRALLAGDEVFRAVFGILELLENELLLQWQLKREGGLSRLFDRHQQWLNRELRCRDGLFARWDDYCDMVLKRVSTPDALLVPDPWRSRVLERMINPDSYPGRCGGWNSTGRSRLLQNCCGVFRELYEIRPHHLVISFLNLVEVGTGSRPEICDPGEAVGHGGESPVFRKLDIDLADLNKPESWAKVPDRLIDFWGRDGDDGTD